MRIKIFLLCFLFSTTVLAEQDPAAQTLAMIEALKQVKIGNAASYKKVDHYIDYNLLTSQSIAPHRSKFSDAQAIKFAALFESLIRKVAYPQSSTFYEEAIASYQPPVITGDRALVVSETSIESEGFEMEIGYLWVKSEGSWRLADLLIDEDSLVKDYQNQFGRLISKEGVDGLIKKIEEKIVEIDVENMKK